MCKYSFRYASPTIDRVNGNHAFWYVLQYPTIYITCFIISHNLYIHIYNYGKFVLSLYQTSQKPRNDIVYDRGISFISNVHGFDSDWALSLFSQIFFLIFMFMHIFSPWLMTLSSVWLPGRSHQCSADWSSHCQKPSIYYTEEDWSS